MSHSYCGDPSSSTLNWVRFTIQDTGPDSDSGEPWYFTDEEINGMIATEGTALGAAVAVLYAWARRLAHNPNFRIGRFSEDWSQAAEVLNAKAAELKAQLSAAVAGAYVGGTSQADKDAKYAATDRTRGAHRRGRFNNPNAGW